MKADFDFDKICRQGALISTFTPLNLLEYIDIPPPPPSSSYHLVGCSPELLPVLLKLDPFRIVHKYMAFTVKKNMIIDLCLPYPDPFHNIYLGRYIIFRGCLIGIRLCTSQTLPGLACWPRKKIKNISIPSISSSQSIVLGQFTLTLKNVRIGLLFSSQLKTIASEYLSYSLDMVTLVGNCELDYRGHALVKELKDSLILIKTESSDYSTLFGQEELLELAGGIISKLPSNRIYLDYYDLQGIFANKSVIRGSRQLLVEIKAINIDLYISQKQPQAFPLYYHHCCFLTSQNNFHLTPSSTLRPDLQKYLLRLCTLLWYSYPNRPLVLLDSSPVAVAFLFLVSQLMQESNNKSSTLTSLFHFVRLKHKQLQLLLQRIQICGKDDIDLFEEQEDSSLQGKLLAILDHAKRKAEDSSEWFVVIGGSEELKNVVELVNKRPSHSANRQRFQTWLHSPFFTNSELSEMFCNPQFISFINCQQYLEAIFLNFNPKPNSRNQDLLTQTINLELSEFELENQLQLRHLSVLLKCSNPLIYGCAKWIKEQGLEFNCQRSIVSHYIVRRYSSLSYHQHRKRGRNFLEIMLMVPKQRLQQYLELLSLPKSYTALHHFITINRLEHHQNNPSEGSKCHHCQLKLPQNYLFQCTSEHCQKNYCYGCLFKEYHYSQGKLMERTGKNNKAGALGKCPFCRTTEKEVPHQSPLSTEEEKNGDDISSSPLCVEKEGEDETNLRSRQQTKKMSEPNERFRVIRERS